MKKFLPLLLLLGIGSSAYAGGIVSSHTSSVQLTVDAARTDASRIGSSFYISSLFGTAVTDITIFLIGIMDQWRQVITADSETAPQILQKTSESLIQVKSLSIIVFVALILWFISKEILNSATINTTSGKALLVSSYVIQTTLIVDGIFIILAILQPTFSGLV